MIVALVVFAIGVSLSAFFSGSETGFYRVTRPRLVIAALRGDSLSKILLWATNNPGLFVATVLVGNNVANYLCSAAIVIGVADFYPNATSAELIAPMLLAPLIFVYGELLPKNLHFRAPNRLLRRNTPGLVIAGVIFAPVIALLWVVSKLLELIGRQSPREVQMVLARRELSELVDEGHAVGLIQPGQQSIAQAAMSLGDQPISEFMIPAARFPRAKTTLTPKAAAELAGRHRRELLPVEGGEDKQRFVGFIRYGECLLQGEGEPLTVHSLMTVSENDAYIVTLSRMMSANQPMARVLNMRGQTTGFVTLADLQQALLVE